MLKRIAHEILESERGADDVILLGIPSRGVPLASRLGRLLAEIAGRDIPVGALDITMHRDDLRAKPTRAIQPTEIPGGTVDGKTVVLVDDVLFSGRTV
ncbi:MAG: phosphoribosyltransferase family protein, partial [Agrococcus casei]